MLLKVAAYCRVSTDNGDQLHSLASQRRFFLEYIQARPDWQLTGIYADEGLSGTSTVHRRQFNRMIADAEAGKIDRILTKEVSRFARNTVDTLEYTRRLSRLGVSVLFINDGIDTMDKDAEFRLGIMAGVAQEESRKTSERVKWGQRRSMEQGVAFGNNTTFGYTTREGRLFVKEPEAETVRLIYHKYVNEGKGTCIIARELFEAGIPPPRSAKKQWANATILKILRNEKYVGDLRQAKSYTVDYLTHKRLPNTDPERQIYLPNHHKAILDRGIWEQAQALLAARRPDEKTRQKYSNRHWCSGRITCGNCGARFVPRENKRPGKEPYRAWACPGRIRPEGSPQQAPNGRCGMRMLNEKSLRACARHVLELLDLDREALLGELLEELKKAADVLPACEIPGLQAQLDTLRRKKEQVLDSHFSGDITREEMQSMKERYSNAISGIQKQLAQCRQRMRLQEEQSANPGRASQILRASLTSSENVFQETVERITVFSDYLLLQVKYLPHPFRIAFTVSGRGASYQTLIESCKYMAPDDRRA